MRRTLLSLLMVSILTTAFAAPSASAKPSVLSLLQACNITVDKKVLFTQEDDEARSATIKLACDTKKVNYDDITIEPIGDQVTASKEGNIISVIAKAGGAGYVLLENSKYIGVKVRFRVFQKFDQETVEQRIKPELTNKEKALVSEFVWFERESRKFLDSTEAINRIGLWTTDYNDFDNVVLPIARQVKYQVKLFKPQTAEFQSIHKLMMQYADLQIEAYTVIKQSHANGKYNDKIYKKGVEKQIKSLNSFKEALIKCQDMVPKVYSFIEEI